MTPEQHVPLDLRTAPPTGRAPSPRSGRRRFRRRAPRIGLVAPPWIPTPPPAYGGIEAVVAPLAERLAARGSDVTLVAAPGSTAKASRVVPGLGHLPATMGASGEELAHALIAVDALADCDVVIDHCGPASAAVLAGHREGRTLHVIHGAVDGWRGRLYANLVRHAPQLGLIALTRAQAMALPVPVAGICPNGVDLARVPFRARGEGYLAFLGRISPDKGAAEAIAIARRAGMPLVMAAKCRDDEERRHFDEHVAPHVGHGVEWLGEIGTEDKYRLLGGASALLFPIDWAEPFGMVMVEAMACGTPVVATRRGSVPEVVRDGVSGLVGEHAGDLVELVRRVSEIDRRDCRAWVRERFSVDVMARAYERVAGISGRVRALGSVTGVH